MDTLLLGIDVGTTAVKAALFSVDGQQQGAGSAEYPTHYVRPGWVEQNPEDWWQATCGAIRQALTQTPRGAQRVAGVAVSSQAPTMLPLDRDGKPLRPALIWMDRRAEAEAQHIAETLGAANVHRISGNRPDAFYVAAKLLWFARHEPQLLRQTHQFMQINGYIAFRLGNAYSLDPVHAALLQLREYATGQWSPALCDLCGVTPQQFPPVMAGHQVMGDVTREAADATGLRAGTPVMVGSVDGSAAALEAGVVETGSAVEMTGTSTVVLMPNASGLTEPSLIAMPHAIPNLHLLLGATVASGASLRWFRDQFAQVENQLAQASGRDAFDLLTEQAAQSPAGSDGVLFLPYMMGERSPLWHTHARGVFFGLSLSTTRGAMIRAILEGAAFALRHNIEVAGKAGAQVSELRSVGGGARSALWNQIKADVLGIPLLLPEASAGAPFGDALLVGMGLGLYPDIQAEVRARVRIRTRFEPNAANHERYSRQYALFRSVYEHLKGDFDAAAE
ncbi:MAG: FGGY-family carbohydrate kinase [Anaerolineae bacterium]